MGKNLGSEELRDGATMSKTILRATMLAVAYNNSKGLQIAGTDAPALPPVYNSSNYDVNAHTETSMLFVSCIVVTVIGMVVMCYVACESFCFKKRLQENEPTTPISHRRSSRPDNSIMGTIMLDPTQCSEISDSQPSPYSMCFVTPEPPPTYESIFDPQAALSPLDKKDGPDNFNIIAPRTGRFSDELEANWINKREYIPRDDQELPSYEAALKLDSNGYV